MYEKSIPLKKSALKYGRYQTQRKCLRRLIMQTVLRYVLILIRLSKEKTSRAGGKAIMIQFDALYHFRQRMSAYIFQAPNFCQVCGKVLLSHREAFLMWENIFSE